jgi:hypothetical protein
VRRPQGSWGNFVGCSAFEIRVSQVHGEMVLKVQGDAIPALFNGRNSSETHPQPIERSESRRSVCRRFTFRFRSIDTCAKTDPRQEAKGTNEDTEEIGANRTFEFRASRRLPARSFQNNRTRQFPRNQTHSNLKNKFCCKHRPRANQSARAQNFFCLPPARPLPSIASG